MANGRVTEAALASIARMPKLTRIGFHEAVVSYENGLKFLAPMKGKLKELDVSMSLVSEADLEKLKGDQPNRVQFLFRESLVVVAHRSRSMACH